MLENTVVNYPELERYLEKVLKEAYLNSYVFDNIEDQLFEKITSNDLQENDMITGVELSSAWTKSGNAELIDFINIEGLIWENDSLSLKVKY